MSEIEKQKQRRWRVRCVAKYLGVTPDTIYSYFKRRRISLKKMGGGINFPMLIELRRVYEPKKKSKAVTETEYRDLCYLCEMTADEVQMEIGEA